MRVLFDENDIQSFQVKIEKEKTNIREEKIYENNFRGNKSDRNNLILSSYVSLFATHSRL